MVSLQRHWGSISFRRLHTSGASSQLSSWLLSWLYRDIQYNLKSFLEHSLCQLTALYSHQGNQERQQNGYAKWKGILKNKMANARLLPIFTFHFLLFRKELIVSDLLTVAAKKCKMPLLLLPNLNVPDSNLEMAFLFNRVEKLSRSNVGFEYSPFCLSGTASATIWCPLSALEQPFPEESNFIEELFFYRTETTLSTHTNPSEEHNYVVPRTTAYHNCLHTLPGVA